MREERMGWSMPEGNEGDGSGGVIPGLTILLESS